MLNSAFVFLIFLSITKVLVNKIKYISKNKDNAV